VPRLSLGERAFACYGANSMKRVLFLLLALSSLAAQQPPDESNLPESERQIPPGHYCKRADVTITPREKNAHPCSCKYSCSINEKGEIVEHEEQGCKAFCHANGRRCTCHVEEPCEPKGNALMDMDGNVVAVRR